MKASPQNPYFPFLILTQIDVHLSDFAPFSGSVGRQGFGRCLCAAREARVGRVEVSQRCGGGGGDAGRESS